jgi:hypothetical protein
MLSTVSLTTLSELSIELDKKIGDLESLSCKSEKVLRFLNLCKLENDPLHEQDNETAFCSQNNVEPDKLVQDNVPKFALTVEGAKGANCPTANTLEDVLSMARAIRSKGAGQTLLPQNVANEKERSVTVQERKPAKCVTLSSLS